MKYLSASIGGLLVAVVIYMVSTFVMRSMTDGLGAAAQVAAYAVAGLIAVTAGWGSFKASLRRKP